MPPLPRLPSFLMVARLPLAARLWLAFGLVLGLLGGVVAVALVQVQRLGESSRALAGDALHQVQLARQAEDATHQGAQALLTLFLAPGADERVALNATVNAADKAQRFALSALLEDARNDEDRGRMRVIAHERERYEQIYARLSRAEHLTDQQVHEQLSRELLPALQAVLDALDLLVDEKNGEAAGTLNLIVAQQEAARERILMLAAAAVLVALVAVVRITRSITRPLAETVALANEIAADRLDTPMPRTRLDEVGRLIAALGAMRESLARRRERIVDLAYRDTLTGLANRTLFQDRLAQAVGISGRTGQILSVLMIDLDRFKQVNDMLGHPVGDALLVQVARRLSHELRRTTDTVARIGGDEFAVLLPALGREGATRLARQLQEALEQPVTVEGQTVDVRGSIGIATFPEDGLSPADLMAHADAAMYVAKSTNSGYAAFDTRMVQPVEHGLSLLSDLQRAMHEDEFFLQFQPKVALGDRRCHSAEVLIRWNHPERGLVPPDQFIPFAEQTGGIKAITRWVLTRSLAQLAQWRAQGLRLSLNVNISTRDLVQNEFPAQVEQMLQAAGVAPAQLCLEVTEGSIMADPHQALRVLRQLHEMGVKLSIDDFGTGYSSLAYLKRLPVQELKIDRAFVRHLDHDPADQDIVRFSIELAHRLGKVVVAEGVETEAVARLLGDMGCDAGQGWLFGRPMNAPDFADWVRARQAESSVAVPAA